MRNILDWLRQWFLGARTDTPNPTASAPPLTQPSLSPEVTFDPTVASTAEPMVVGAPQMASLVVAAAVNELSIGLAVNPGLHEVIMPSADELRALGAQWVRYLPPHQYQNFESGQNGVLDFVLGRTAPAGVKVLVLVNPETLNSLPPSHPSATIKEWGDINSGYIGHASNIIQRIASYYRDRIQAIEIFNEPELQNITPEDYGRLLAACYQRVKSVSNLPVISAGLIFDESFDYLRRMKQASNGAYDGIGWHPYAMRVDGFPIAGWGRGEMRDSLVGARQVGGKPLWLTEIGANLGYTWPGLPSVEQGAAEYLTRSIQMARGLGSDVVANAFWFTWKFPPSTGEPGSDYGLVDLNNNRRPAWDAFRQQTQNISNAPPQITAVKFTPATLDQDQVLNVSVTIRNNSSGTYPTQRPAPGTQYEEGETFVSRNFNATTGGVRVGVDFDGRSGIDRPYRWGLGTPLRPGQTATITGRIRLKSAQTREYWAGVVREQIAWDQDNVGRQLITVNKVSRPPTITNVSYTPTAVNAGQILTIAITVRNDSDETLTSQGPPPNFTYEEGESYLGRGFPETNSAFRVGVEFERRSLSIEYPYRWGLGAPLPPGQSTTIACSIRLKNPQTQNYWVGLVREQVQWIQRDISLQAIVVQPEVDCSELQEQVIALQQQITQLRGENDQLRKALQQVKQIVQGY